MRLLLDTHSFLWFVTDDPQLSANAQALVADPTNEIVVSPASYWEVAIKVSIGKYPLDQAIAEQIPVVSVDSTFDSYGVTRLW
jgi:PIN domain nuclease of toxin-antitoxin system